VPQTGSAKPLIRPLEGAIQIGLANLVQAGEGILPLDPSRGGALKALVQKTNLLHIFKKGGPIMWPLLLASILALGTVLERVFFLLNETRKRDPKALERLLGDVERGDVPAALRDSNGLEGLRGAHAALRPGAQGAVALERAALRPGARAQALPARDLDPRHGQSPWRRCSVSWARSRA
jgi:hypothetical protein